MKKYKNGLVLGKFYPITLGHKYLIDTAIENSQKTHVIISHNSTQSIPGSIRFEALKELYKDNDDVTIYEFDDYGLPQSDTECDTLEEFYAYWIPEVYKLVNELDVVFTSEDYGDSFAEFLGIEHFLVDKERSTYPISGTRVRNNPFNEWGFIPQPMKKYFIKRVAIMGPESVGKSTLTKLLAKEFNTNFVEEYGRTVYEENGNFVGVEDFRKISLGRQKLEDDLIKHSNKIIFCDTEDITTHIFLNMYCDGELSVENKWFDETIDDKRKFDSYILLKPDCEGIQDGTRVFLEERIEHYEVIKNRLIKNKCNFIEIGGSWKDRFDDSVKYIKTSYSI